MQELLLNCFDAVTAVFGYMQIAISNLNPLLAAVFIYILGQYILKIIIEPAQQFKKTLGELHYFLLFYGSRVVPNFGTVKEEQSHLAYEECARLSAKIYADARVIPIYSLMSFLFFLPKRKNLADAVFELNALANFCYSKHEDVHRIVEEKIKKIKFILGLV